MAKQVIVKRISNDRQGNLLVNVLNWYAVTAQAAVPGPGQSQWSGASVAENSAISNGTVIEEAIQYSYAATTTEPTIKADLLARWGVRQTAITSAVNPNSFYGIYYDPSASGWSA